MEILTAYVRENGQWKEVDLDEINPLAADIQAIVTVLRRREWSCEKSDQLLDLHAVDLHGAHLYQAHLERADLQDAHLKGAQLWEAHLERAVLTDTRQLTQEQVKSAIGDATTKLPPDLVMPESWKKQAS